MKTIKIMNVISTIILIIWILVSGYLCIGSLVLIESMEKVKLIENRIEENITNQISIANKEGHSFNDAETIISRIKKKNKELSFEDEQAIRNLEYGIWYYSFTGYSFITFITILPYFALLFLGAGASGCLGSTARIMYDHVKESKQMSSAKFLSQPAFGFFIGIMVLAISFVIPTIFVKGESTLNFTSTILIGFFAGIFSDHFFAGIKNLISNIIKPVNS